MSIMFSKCRVSTPKFALTSGVMRWFITNAKRTFLTNLKGTFLTNVKGTFVRMSEADHCYLKNLVARFFR